MAEFFFSYGLFLAKGLTLLLLFGLAIGLCFILGSRSASLSEDEPQLKVVKLNDELEDTKLLLQDNLLDQAAAELFHQNEKKRLKKEFKDQKKAAKQRLKLARKSGESEPEPELDDKKRVFVLRFDGDTQASAVEGLRREVTAILSLATDKDEVVVKLDSPGGQVAAYGLAASQLDRFRQHGVSLTVCVDEVAASGGYMMAAVANKIIAAPFAIIGSIGVVAQLPNIHRVLKKHDVDIELHTAGAYKRTLTVLGENTDEGRAKFQEELEEIHSLFKAHIHRYRPTLDIEKVATGEFWLATNAAQLGLIDQLMTSDEYLVNAAKESDVFMLSHVKPKRLLEKLGFEALSNGLIKGAFSALKDKSVSDAADVRQKIYS